MDHDQVSNLGQGAVYRLEHLRGGVLAFFLLAARDFSVHSPLSALLSVSLALSTNGSVAVAVVIGGTLPASPDSDGGSLSLSMASVASGGCNIVSLLDMKMERLHRGKPIPIMTTISLGWFDK